MAALYSNENYPLGIVEHLRALGHDVLTSREAGNADRGVPDEEVLAFATAQGRAVITHNRKHFFRLHAATAEQMAELSPAPSTLTKRARLQESTQHWAHTRMAYKAKSCASTALPEPEFSCASRSPSWSS